MARSPSVVHTADAHQRCAGRRWTLAVAMTAAFGGACQGSTEPRERVRTYEIAEMRVPCSSVGGLSVCYSARTPPDTAWQVLHAAIEGFTYEPGHRYVLRVAEREVRNPAPDGPGILYRLVEVVAKTRVAP